jgi:hypothetical protein
MRGHLRSAAKPCGSVWAPPRIYYYRTLEQETEIPGEVVVVFQDD